jgi:hypothetical protein
MAPPTPLYAQYSSRSLSARASEESRPSSSATLGLGITTGPDLFPDELLSRGPEDPEAHESESVSTPVEPPTPTPDTYRESRESRDSRESSRRASRLSAFLQRSPSSSSAPPQSLAWDQSSRHHGKRHGTNSSSRLPYSSEPPTQSLKALNNLGLTTKSPKAVSTLTG